MNTSTFGAAGRGRVRKTLMLLAAAAPVLYFVVMILVAELSTSGDWVWVGSRQAREFKVPRLHYQLFVTAVLIALFSPFALRLIQATRRVWREAPKARAQAIRQRTAELELGEVILWQGRPGWRSISRAQLALTVAACLGPVLFLSWMHHIWSRSDPVAMKLLATTFAMMLLGGTVMFVLQSGLDVARYWSRILFGTMAVTDRRIAWLTPLSGKVYRAISGGDLVEAAVVEGTAERGWITVTESKNGEIREIDFFGVPQPADAVRAVEQVIARTKAT